MADPTYVMPGVAIHSFLMFAPLFAMYEKKWMVIRGIILFVSGPYLASIITPDPLEQASIWCFFSIAQIFLFLFTIPGALFVNRGRNIGHASPVKGNKVNTAKDKVVEEMKSKKLT
jgi:hypothetical protein